MQPLTAAINSYRQENHLPALVEHPALMLTAQQHSDFMASRGVLTHRGTWLSEPEGRIQRAGYVWTAVGEDIDYGEANAQDVMTAWKNSPEHNAIMLSPAYTHVGVGQTGVFWTADFAAGEPVT